MTLKIGVIGTGMIGRDHTRRIEHVLAGAKIVALSDYTPSAARAVQADLAPNATLYETGEELIASPEVDAVLVCSTGATHEAYVLAAIKAGKPCFCEKPLATTAELLTRKWHMAHVWFRWALCVAMMRDILRSSRLWTHKLARL